MKIKPSSSNLTKVRPIIKALNAVYNFDYKCKCKI